MSGLVWALTVLAAAQCGNETSPGAALEAASSGALADFEEEARVLTLAAEQRECLALLRGEPGPCETLRGRPGGLEEACLRGFHLLTFMRSAVRSKEDGLEKAIEGCERSGLFGPDLFRIPAREVCGRFARAYRSGYLPVCSGLATSENLRGEEQLHTFHFMCRTSFYPVFGCGEARRVAHRRECEHREAALRSLRAGDPRLCGGSALCRALLEGAEGTCLDLGREVVEAFCRARRPAGVPGGKGPP